MSNSSIGSPEQLRDPNYTPPLYKAIPLGIQHVLAMFVSNVTPAIIVAGAAGFGFGSNSPDFPELLYLIQMSMVFAGGGVNSGHVVGATNEIGDEAVDVVHPIKDVHVTLLKLLGLDDNKLTYFHGGRFKQLSQTGGEVIDELIA